METVRFLGWYIGMRTRLSKNDISIKNSPAENTEECKVSSERIRNWPTKERPRERLLAIGPERLTDADLLAIILRVGSGTFKEGVPGKNAYESALSILRDFRGLRGLDRARIHDLLKVHGLRPAKVAQIKAAFELGKRVCAGKLTAPSFESSKAVAEHFRPRFTGKRQEIVIALFLNGQNQLLGEKDITEGTPTQATVYVRRILEERVSACLSARAPAGNADPASQLRQHCRSSRLFH